VFDIADLNNKEIVIPNMHAELGTILTATCSKIIFLISGSSDVARDFAPNLGEFAMQKLRNMSSSLGALDDLKVRTLVFHHFTIYEAKEMIRRQFDPSDYYNVFSMAWKRLISNNKELRNLRPVRQCAARPPMLCEFLYFKSIKT
jgi:hypothetical protein